MAKVRSPPPIPLRAVLAPPPPRLLDRDLVSEALGLVPRESARRWFLRTLLFLASLLLVGSLAFRYLYSTGLPHADVLGPVGLALLAAPATLFAPYAIPLLAGYLALQYHGSEHEPRATHWLRLAAAGILGLLTGLLAAAVLLTIDADRLRAVATISASGASPALRFAWGALGSLLFAAGLYEILRAGAPASVPRDPPRPGRTLTLLFLCGLALPVAALPTLVTIVDRIQPSPVALLAYVATLLLFFLLSANLAHRPDPRVTDLLPPPPPQRLKRTGLLHLVAGTLLILATVFVGPFVRIFVPLAP